MAGEFDLTSALALTDVAQIETDSKLQVFAASGFRMLAFTRGGRAALELVKQGVAHVAAVHRSTADRPDGNAAAVREVLGAGFRLLRCADWQAGLALPADNHARSLTACLGSIRHWAAREPGSAARECLEELTGRPFQGKRTLGSHQAVAETVKGGWAEAGVCVRLCAVDAGLNFLPVRAESLDLCFPAAMEYDPRIQALIGLLRGRKHRRLLEELPGYDSRRTGDLSVA